MRTFKLFLLLLLVVALGALVLQNQAPWEVRFLWMNGEMPGILVLFLTAAAGFVAGITIALLLKRGGKPPHHKTT